MTARLARVRAILAEVSESISVVRHEVLSAGVRVSFPPRQAAYFKDLEAAEATSRALERSILLVEQLRLLRLAVLNGWNGPVAAKSEGPEIQDLARRSLARMGVVRTGVLVH